MKQIWFTSDTHFGHENIIKHASRPYASAQEMDAAMIDNLNTVVRPTDTLYHLGDWSWGTLDQSRVKMAKHYRDQVRCRDVRLLRGNHDPTSPEFDQLFTTVKDLEELLIQGQRIVLCHYAMRVWNKSHAGTIHLFGHSHGTLPLDLSSLSLDVGVDPQQFVPVTFDQVFGQLYGRTFVAKDHHGR